MADTKKSKTDGEVIADVAKPDETVPSSTSKPIIISHRPVLKDPMMVDEQSAQEDDKKTPQAPLKPTSKLKITPISPQQVQTTESNEATTGAPEPATESSDTDSDKKEASEEPTSPSFDTDEPEKKKSSEANAAELEKETKRTEELAKLVENRTYYLPINQVEKRRNKHYAIGGILLIIVLGLAWADVALDAGILTISGVKAPTHFFSR